MSTHHIYLCTARCFCRAILLCCFFFFLLFFFLLPHCCLLACPLRSTALGRVYPTTCPIGLVRTPWRHEMTKFSLVYDKGTHHSRTVGCSFNDFMLSRYLWLRFAYLCVSSVNPEVRGAQAGVGPPRRSPPRNVCYDAFLPPFVISYAHSPGATRWGFFLIAPVNAGDTSFLAFLVEHATRPSTPG